MNVHFFDSTLSRYGDHDSWSSTCNMYLSALLSKLNISYFRQVIFKNNYYSYIMLYIATTEIYILE